MRAPRRALEGAVRLQVEVEMPHRRDVRVDDEPWLQVLFDVGSGAPAVLFCNREEARLVAFPDDDEGDEGPVLSDGSVAGVRFHGGVIAGFDDLGELLLLDGSVLGVGDAVAVEEDPLGEVAVRFLPG